MMNPSDEAVEAAALALFADEHCDKRQMQDVRGNWDARLNDEDQALYRSMARAALEAALPYLAPAEPTDREAVEEVAADILGLISPVEMRANLRQEEVEDEFSDWSNFVRTTDKIMALMPAAPAGDGGLREAQLRQEFRAEIMRGYQAALCNSDVPGWTLGDEVGKVADKLLAIPRAPAVPQPVDREALAKALKEHHPTAGMAVASGVTCQCGYWNGNERPGVDRPAGAQGRDGLDWHRAQVVLALLGLEVPSDQPGLGDGVRDLQVAEPPRGCLGDGVCTNPKCPVHGIKEEPRDQPR